MAPSLLRSMPDAPVIDAGMARLICSCQTGCQSGRYLGPKEKIKADKAFALALERKLMGARGAKSSVLSAFPETDLAMTLKRELGGNRMELSGVGRGARIEKL